MSALRSAAPSSDRVSPGSVGALSLLAVACLTIMVGCVIVPGLPRIGPALGVGRSAGWLITLPSLGVVLFAPLAGRLIDRLGAYRTLCGGLVGYGLLGLTAIGLHGAAAVFADRVLLGGATALVMSADTALISAFYDGDARLAMIARQGMAIELGGVIFLSIGGYLTGFGWAAPFGLYAMAFVFLLMVLAFVPRPLPASCSGSVADAPGRSGALAPVLVAALCSMLVFFTAVIILPFRLSDPAGAGLTEAQTGYFLSFVSLVAVGFASVMPRVSLRIGEQMTLVVAFVSYALAHIAFALAHGLPIDLLGGLLLGAGFGLSIPLVNHMTVDRSPASQRGRHLARLSIAIFLG
jgi:MFS family permease